MKIKLTITYDGTNYCGWQVQNNGITVQQVITEAINKLTGESVKLTGSGRTDAGVHAEGQVASFSVQTESIPPLNYAKALNTLLPEDVKIISSQKVSEDFDARYSAKRKTYEYRLYESSVILPLKERYAVRAEEGLNLERLQTALNEFVGEKDFKSFCASKSGAKTTVRTIYRAKVKKENGFIVIEFCGNGFLYNMVRILCGTALGYAQGKITLEEIRKMFLEDNRSLGGKTLLAKGLTLKSVEY